MKLSQDLLNLISHLHEEMYYSQHFSTHVLPELLFFTGHPSLNSFYTQQQCFTDGGIQNRGLALSNSENIIVADWDYPDILEPNHVTVPDEPIFTIDDIDTRHCRWYVYADQNHAYAYSVWCSTASFSLWVPPLKYNIELGTFIHYYHQSYYDHFRIFQDEQYTT